MRLLDWNNQDLTDFPWKMEDIETKADTFIEWCFEQKLYGIQNGADILNAWKNRKREYESYIATTVFDFQHYSRHDASHSINILNTIELVLGRKRVKELSVSDLWLLLECAYFHDTGMALSNEEIRELWTGNKEFKVFLYKAMEANDYDKKQAALYYKQMNELLTGRKLSGAKIEFPLDWPIEMEKHITVLTGEFIRKNHPKKARENMEHKIWENDSNKEKDIIGKRLNILVGKISELHGEDYANIKTKLKYKELGFATDYLHPQFAAVMLRLGDLLDMDNDRFNVRAIEHFGKLPALSEIHYKKHKALTDFCIDERQIMAESFSESEEVCRVTGEWFQWLDSEVNNLICDWNTFAPEKIKGCILNRCQLKIYCNNKPFEMKLQKNFEVDKQRLINLMIGSNIYDSGLDCFREYIQNAFDACKMMLRHEMKNGRAKWDDLQKLTPFDVNNNMYEELAVEIHVTVEGQRVCFRIRDYGVGMEEECVNNLSVIGRSWKNRSLYQEAAVEMPAWMKPTGGFGIGLQSAFMLTDQVKILTRSVQEIKSHVLVLDSPARKGTVTRSEEESVPVGTEITFEVPLDKMTGLIKEVTELKLDRHTELNLMFENDCDDSFRKENITDYIIRFLKYYIARTFPDTLFPIQLYEGDRKVYTHRSLYADEKREGFGLCKFKSIKKDSDEYRYHVEENLTVRIWDVKDNTFVCIKCWPGQIPGVRTMSPTLLNAFCYKGARVEKLREEDRNYIFYNFLSVCIDFMGLNMSQVMALERNSFAQDFDILTYYRRYIKIYLEIVYEEHIKAKVSLDKVQENLNLFLYVLAAIQLLEKNKVIAVMEHCNSELKSPENIIVKVIKDKTMEKSRMETSAVLRELRNIFERKVTGEAENKEVIFLAIRKEDYEKIMSATGQKAEKEKMTQVSLLNLLEEKDNDSLLPEEMEVPRKIARYMEKGIRIYMNNDITNALIWLGYKFDMSFFRLNEDDECIYAMIVGFNGDWEYCDQEEIDKDTFLKKAFQWNRVRYIGKNVNCPEYDNLRVDMLPMQNVSKWFGKRKERYLISPISNTVYLEILKAADIQLGELKENSPIIMKHFISQESFVDIVTGVEEYDFLISWVKEHQIEDEKLDTEEISSLYQTMIRDIYDRNLQEEPMESEA